VEFTTCDLRQSMAARGPFDVVFCRNVLIYFDMEAKRKILEEIRGTLFRGGYLLLGGSETTLNITNQYERRIIGQTVLYQVS
jgi:chemotaxis protein methyltransferase CheR